MKVKLKVCRQCGQTFETIGKSYLCKHCRWENELIGWKIYYRRRGRGGKAGNKKVCR